MCELNVINDCRDVVVIMNVLYFKDFQFKGKIVDVFFSMDFLYDLEKFSILYQEEVKLLKVFDCKVDLFGIISKVNIE